jgi:hypothetical protein
MSNQLQNKLLQYEANPPEGVWNKIAASIEGNISFSLSQKLYQYEEEPSSAIWQNIVVQLNSNSTEKTTVVPFYSRYRRPLQYSGAAALFIFLAVLTSLLISKKTESELSPEGIVHNSLIKEDSAKTPVDSENNNSSAPEKENRKPERTIAKSKVLKGNHQRLSTSNSISFIENFLPRQAERNEIMNPSIDADKYMIYSDDEGNVIRLPKKIFSAFACSTEDLICKQRLQNLREKFAASATTADFTGVLQILKSLQENQ